MPFGIYLSMTYRCPLYSPVVTCKSFFTTKPRNPGEKTFPPDVLEHWPQEAFRELKHCISAARVHHHPPGGQHQTDGNHGIDAPEFASESLEKARFRSWNITVEQLRGFYQIESIN
jgi:hypothetical protein